MEDWEKHPFVQLYSGCSGILNSSEQRPFDSIGTVTLKKKLEKNPKNRKVNTNLPQDSTILRFLPILVGCPSPPNHRALCSFHLKIVCYLHKQIFCSSLHMKIVPSEAPFIKPMGAKLQIFNIFSTNRSEAYIFDLSICQ